MCSSRFSLRGRTCVITGATSGIGHATARALGSAGADLVLLGRRAEAGSSVVSALSRLPGAGNVEFLRTDLSEQHQVRATAANIIARHPTVDILINNAGARFNSFRQNQDAIELTFATNHLGHFLLTHLLLPAMLRAPAAKVVTLGSSAHGGISSHGAWYLDRASYDRKLAYGKSKLANIVFAYDLARRLSGTGIISNAVDPGGVATNLGRNNGLVSWCRHLVYYSLRGELLSPRRGAETVIALALDPSFEGISGKYFHRNRQVDSSPASRDIHAAASLWAISLQLTGLDESETPPLAIVRSP